MQKSIEIHVTLSVSGASTKRLPHKTLKDAFYVTDILVKQTPTVYSDSKPSKIAAQEKGKSLVNENSTRIFVRDLYQQIQEEKMKYPKNPFKKEFLVVLFCVFALIVICKFKKIAFFWGNSTNPLILYKHT